MQSKRQIISIVAIAAWFGVAMFGRTQPAPPDSSAGPSPAPTVTTAPAVQETDQTLRSYLRLQEQLHAALLAVEQARMEASLEARTNADLLAAGLGRLELALADERRQQQTVERNANRALLILGAAVLGIGLVALVVTAFLQARGMNRLAEIALGVPGGRTPGLPALESLSGPSPTLFLAPERKTPDSDRLLSTIGRLETRIHELEHSAQRALAAGPADQATTGATNGSGDKSSALAVEQLAGLLGKGQALLQLGRAGKALDCFEDAIARAPESSEAMIGKGMALERLERLDEALACYDRAMEMGRCQTQASLRKAEILSRQERFAEALECYEQALRAGAKA